MVLASRFFKNKFRWFGLILAVTSVAILSSANISTQWVGWSLSVAACVMWVWFGMVLGALGGVGVMYLTNENRVSRLENEIYDLRVVRKALKEEIIRLQSKPKPTPRKRRKRI